MANVKISQLPLATSPLDSTVEMPVVQGGVTKRAGMTTIGFTQAGTGAVLRTAQDKMRETVSVKDFGAVGDGVANDRSAFVSAVAAAAGSEILIPAGVYNIATPYAAPASTRFFMQTGASFTGNKPSGASYVFETGNQSSAGGLMKIDFERENSTTYPPENEGGIWTADTYAHVCVSSEMTATTVPAPGDGTLTGGPLASIFSFVNNNNSGGDVVAFLGNAVARTSNDTVFGANLIARNDAGANNVKLVGAEIDIQPVLGTTVAPTSTGLLMNVFSISSSATMFLGGGVSSGTWANGFITGAITGAHYSVASTDATPSVTFINTVAGTFSGGAIQLGTGAGQGVNFGAASFGVSPFLYGDSGQNLIANFGSANTAIFQNAAGTQIARLLGLNGGAVLEFATESTTDAAAPAANAARLYTRDNGSGKTQLVVRFPTGAVQVLATEP